MPLGPINQIAITTGPRPTHGGYPPTALHQPANNHPQTNNSAYPRALKRGGRRMCTVCTPPTTTTIGNTSTRTQTIRAGQLTLLNLSPRHQKYTTPPPHHHRGLPPGAATPPIPPYPWFPQQRWSRLEWARGIIGSATLRPPLCRDAVGLRRAAPHTWHDDLCGFFKLCFNAVWTRAKTSVHVPLDCPPGPGPPSGASLGGPTMGQIGWGGPSTGPTLFFWCSRGVSVSV